MRPLLRAAVALTAAALQFLVVAGAGADDIRAGDLTVSTPWTRATAPGMAAAVGFFTVSNASGAADRLIGASTPAATKVEIHRSSMVDGIMRMEAMDDGVEIPAGAAVAFAPGGLHLMLVAPKEPFAVGAGVPMTLEFERAGRVDVLLSVEPAGAVAPHGGH